MARGGVSYNAFRNPAKSQNFIRQLPSGGPALTYPLDGFPLPSLLYSYRTMLSGWVGREICAIRVNGAGTFGSGGNLNGEYIVRDSSLIGITGVSLCTCYSGGDAGNIRTLSQLLTQGGNNSIFVLGLFDQSGALPSRELSQTVAANQPALTSSAGVLNTYSTSGRTSQQNSATTGMNTASLAVSILCNVTTAASTAAYILETYQRQQFAMFWQTAFNNRYVVHPRWEDNNLYVDVGTDSSAAGGGRITGANTAEFHQFVYQRSSLAVGNVYRGATLLVGRTDMGTVPTGNNLLTYGNNEGLTLGLVGANPELVLWNTDQYANITSFLSAQRTFWAV